MGGLVNVSEERMLGLEEYGSDEALAAVELFAGYPDGLLTFASLCCYLFMVIGIPGNLITIVALARCTKVRNATAVFIISLSLADLLFCCFILPLAGSRFWYQSWRYGRTLCKLFPMARYSLVAISLLTVLAITLNRYIMIAHPRLYPKLYTSRNIVLIIVFLWLFCFSLLIPTWFEKWGKFSLDTEVGSCSIIPDENGISPKKTLFVGGFLVPLLLIVACYARIFWIVKKVAKRSRPVAQRPKTEVIRGTLADVEVSALPTNTKHISLPPKKYHNPLMCLTIPEISSTTDSETSTHESREKRMTNSDKFFSRSNEALQKIRLALTVPPKQTKQKLLPSKKDRKLRTMIMAIMLSLLICHLPISITKVFMEVTSHPFLNIASYITLYLTTCINPIIYVVMSNEYRQAYKNLITCRKVDPDFPEPTVLRRITSLKTIASIRKSRREHNSIKAQLPT